MGVSTHVLDLVTGQPAAGVGVRLEHGGVVVGGGTTDGDGRVATLGDDLESGVYTVTFDTAGYGNAFYPQVVVTFTVADPTGHYHVPLLLSPHGYTTYRGS